MWGEAVLYSGLKALTLELNCLSLGPRSVTY